MSRRHKYGAIPTVVDGVRFASKAEAARYAELRLLEKAGEIRDLRLQPVFPLWAFTVDPSQPTPIGNYIADFAYETAAGTVVVEDVKGMRTPLYNWKKKHVEAQYRIAIAEIGRQSSRRGVGRRKVSRPVPPGDSKRTRAAKNLGGQAGSPAVPGDTK